MDYAITRRYARDFVKAHLDRVRVLQIEQAKQKGVLAEMGEHIKMNRAQWLKDLPENKRAAANTAVNDFLASLPAPPSAAAAAEAATVEPSPVQVEASQETPVVPATQNDVTMLPSDDV